MVPEVGRPEDGRTRPVFSATAGRDTGIRLAKTGLRAGRDAGGVSPVSRPRLSGVSGRVAGTG